MANRELFRSAARRSENIWSTEPDPGVWGKVRCAMCKWYVVKELWFAPVCDECYARWREYLDDLQDPAKVAIRIAAQFSKCKFDELVAIAEAPTATGRQPKVSTYRI